MVLKLYFDFSSQPSRALYIFMKTCQIPFEPCIVHILKGQNYNPDYEEIHPFSKVPAIDHDGFNLIESVGIVRYLSREFPIAEHWYPKSARDQARVDEYLEWQHLNIRLYCSRYFLGTVTFPMIRQTPQRPERVEEFKTNMIESINSVEDKWLGDKDFIMGNEISVADIFAACEIEQTRMAGYDPREGRPKLSKWFERVAEKTAPYYSEAHSNVESVVKRLAGRPPHTCLIDEIFQ